jgi:hypothetical protein
MTLTRTLPAVLALSLAIAGCSESPVTLRIVSGPPAANQEVVALLVSASDAVDTPVRYVPGGRCEAQEPPIPANDKGPADNPIDEKRSILRDTTFPTVPPI